MKTGTPAQARSVEPQWNPLEGVRVAQFHGASKELKVLTYRDFSILF